MPIFCGKSVKIYIGQKNLHENSRGFRDKYEVWLCSRQIMFSSNNLPVLSKYSGEKAVTWWRRRELPLMPLCLHLSPPAANCSTRSRGEPADDRTYIGDSTSVVDIPWWTVVKAMIVSSTNRTTTSPHNHLPTTTEYNCRKNLTKTKKTG